MRKKLFTFLLALVTSVGLSYAAVDGKLPGAFTVDGSGTQVYFSQGNLQATTNDLGATWTWGFAENQWDYVGNNAANNAINGGGTVSSNGAVDLFGWSSDDNNYFGIDNSDDLTDYDGNFQDWGAKMGSDWRTLTYDEWNYLLNTRVPGSSAASTSNPRFARAQIFTDGTAPSKDIYGLILFPDDFNDGGYIDGVTWNGFNSYDAVSPTYCTTAGWATLESMGCVFLPASGWRSEGAVTNVGTYGIYWASTKSTETDEDASCMYFFSNNVAVFRSYFKTGASVRLVSETAPGGSTPTTSGSCGANVTWEFDPSTGALTITGTGAMDDYLNNASTPWNSYITDITSVTITDGVTNVGNHSFEQCTSLTTVTIGDDVETIGTFAFSECGEQFTTLTLGNSIRTIGNQAFASNYGITGFTLPSTLETIGNFAFIHSKAITTLTIPSNVTSIDVDAFYDCIAVTDVYCYPNAADLTWDDGDCDDFKSGKATICHVNADQLDAYQTKFNDKVRVTFVGDLDAPAPASSVTAARFVYNYDCQRSPGYPQQGSPCTLSGFKDPYEGYKGSRNGNIALGPWKLEFVAYYTPSNNYDCASQVNSAVNQYYMGMSSEEKEAKKLEVPIFRLLQYNLTAREYQHATYGIVCAYAGEANAQDHAALFVSSNDYGCFLSGHQHTTSFALTCENDLTTGLAALVTAASATDPDYDAYMPVIVSIDAIGPVELSEHCKYYIEGSRAAYDALTDEQKAQVTNYSTLTDAETQWAALAAVAQPYADPVIDLINAIPNPVVYTQECKDAIDAAQAAYDALTDGQKVLVTNAETLKNAPFDLINAAPYVHILFKANNQERKVENVTLPREFTAAEMTTILKELYGVDGDYSMYAYSYSNSNPDAVNISYEKWTIYPFTGKVNVNGELEKYIPETSGFDRIYFSLEISLDLPPFGPAPTPSGDKLSGVFSISSTETVNFSRGNVQYVSGSWQFAANQWDVIGTSQADGNRDLFGWGTADAPNKVSSEDDYSVWNDWGENIEGGWFTLSNDEWNYLFEGRENYADRRSLGKVNDVYGLILLPDVWNGPAISCTIENFSTNTYSISEWSDMEAAGAVFLPVGGYRMGTTTYMEAGSYWTRTEDNTKAKQVMYGLDMVMLYSSPRYIGASVRLVAASGAPTPTNEQVPTNADPENPSYHYSTFFHSTQNYKLSNDGTQAFIADLSNNELVLTEIAHGEQVIPANTAVILRKTGSADPVVLVPTEENGVSVNSDDNSLRGVDEETTLVSLSIDPLQCYVLSGKSHDETESGVGFYLIYGNTLKAHKAYVIFAGGSNNAPKKMRFVYGQATGIEDVQGNNVQSTKVIENGVLYIIRDGKTYNAMGQMVK